jgi:hypothetical protein
MVFPPITNILIVSSELTLHSDTCGLCFRHVVGIEEFGPVSNGPCTELPLPSSLSTLFGPQSANSQRRREADDFNFSGFKRIQIVSNVLKLTVKASCEFLSLRLQDSPQPACDTCPMHDFLHQLAFRF